MAKDFYTHVGSLLNRDKTPCFAIPVFSSDFGKLFIQELKDNKIILKEVSSNICNDERFVSPMRLHLSSKFIEQNLLYTYAFERDIKFTGTYNEIEKFIGEKYKKYKNEFKNPLILAEIIDFNLQKPRLINLYELEK